MENDDFKPFLKQEDGSIKPIWILPRDGHDGFRFRTTSKVLNELLKENDIDFIVAACNASGLSAYHFVERRMAPPSKELPGIILPHDYFETHLDGNSNTTDPDKELQNLRKTENLLSDI